MTHQVEQAPADAPSSVATRGRTAPEPWWRTAVFYQIYPKSFADGNGDGVGDLIGLRTRLDYLEQLGVDAIWLSPFYPSPDADGGYDVCDPTEVDPTFGTLADFDALVAGAHARGIRVTIDLVPNHSRISTRGSRPPWRPARAAQSEPGSSSAMAGANTASVPRTTGRRHSVAWRGRECRTGSGTCTCSRPSSQT